MLDINAIMVEFGYWATPRYEGEFPRVSAGFAQMECDDKYKSKYRLNRVTDAHGMIIDSYLQIMRRNYRELFDVFVMEYIKRWANRHERWQYFGISKSEYYRRLNIAKVSLHLMLLENEKVVKDLLSRY